MKRLTANDLHTLPDAELMLRVGQGGHTAFDTLYNRYARQMGGFFLRMLAYDTARAEDMVQELFVRVWAHRADYRAAQSFATWLYSMAYNLCKNEYRHEAVRQAYAEECLLGEEPTEQTSEAVEREEQRQRLRQAIQSLPTAQRDAFLLHYDEVAIGCCAGECKENDE